MGSSSATFKCGKHRMKSGRTMGIPAIRALTDLTVTENAGITRRFASDVDSTTENPEVRNSEGDNITI